MIQNDQQLKNSRNYLEGIEDMVANIRQKPIHPTRLHMWLEPYLKEIRKIRNEIDTYLGIRPGYVESVALTIKLSGPSIVDGSIPAKILSNYIYYLQLLFYQTAKSVAKVSPKKKRDRSVVEIENKCKLLVVNTAPGSFTIGFNFEDSSIQMDMFTEMELAKKSLNIVMEIISRITLQKADELNDIIPDELYKNTLLENIKRLTPALAKKIEKVEFQIEGKPELIFDLSARKYIRSLVTQPGEEICEIRGVAREVDLDSKSFHVTQEDNTSLKCCYSDKELLEETVVLILDREIVVSGVAKLEPVTNKIIEISEVEDIEIIERRKDPSRLF